MKKAAMDLEFPAHHATGAQTGLGVGAIDLEGEKGKGGGSSTSLHSASCFLPSLPPHPKEGTILDLLERPRLEESVHPDPRHRAVLLVGNEDNDQAAFQRRSVFCDLERRKPTGMKATGVE